MDHQGDETEKTETGKSLINAVVTEPKAVNDAALLYVVMMHKSETEEGVFEKEADAFSPDFIPAEVESADRERADEVVDEGAEGHREHGDSHDRRRKADEKRENDFDSVFFFRCKERGKKAKQQ